MCPRGRSPPRRAHFSPAGSRLQQPPPTMEEQLRAMIRSLEQRRTTEESAGPGQPGERPGALPPEVVDHLYKAQKFYYGKNYRAALAEVQKSLDLGETAIARALHGTISLALDSRETAIASWKRALEMDPTMTEVEAILKYYEGRK